MSGDGSDIHKFDTDSGMTFREVFGFAFKEWLAPLLRHLETEVGAEDFRGVLQDAAASYAAALGRQMGESAPNCSVSDFTAWIDDRDSLFQRALTYEVVERTNSACEIRVSECLWERTFRQAGAMDIGYGIFCHMDYTLCEAFNPKMRMVRTKCLMQGDACCNHRWILEE